MAINMARSLNSLRPEASALLMENLGMGDSLLRRQSYQTCDTGSLGHNGECREESTCGGALFPGGCPTGFECCFISNCDVAQGSGYCKNNTRDFCNGEFYPGEPPDYPCNGGDEMVCCVNYENMTNGSSPTTSSSPSATGTGANDDSSQNDSLTGSQIGGIVGGIIGAVIVTALIFTFFFWWRRKKAREASAAAAAAAAAAGSQPQAQAQDAYPVKTDGNEGHKLIQEIHGKEYQQLDGNEMVELDGHSGAVHEVEGSAPPRVLAELPASEVKRP